MEKQMIFHVLGIDETKDERKIQDAYRGLLKVTNPEDDPEGFKRLREAYEGALSLARQAAMEAGTEEGGQRELTETEQWIQEADELYSNMKRRWKVSAWEDLLDDPLCEGLDTSLDLRKALLVYLMDHIYLPQAIWQLLDDKFQLLEDMESLKQEFPPNFLDYMAYQIEHKEFLNYELFRVTDREKADGDAWIEHYFEIKRMLDMGTTEGLEQKLEDLSAFGLTHPFADAERLRFYLVEKQMEEAGRLAERLNEDHPEEAYIQIYVADVWWAMERQEEAVAIWRRLLEKNPDHYMAKTGLIRYEMEQGRFAQAKEQMMEQLDQNSHDETILELVKTANSVLIPEYKKRLDGLEKQSRPWKEDAIELGWCLFQEEQPEEACSLLTSFQPDDDQRYTYVNLLGRIFYQLEQYEEAVPYLDEWVHIIRDTVDDGSRENRKRISRWSRACHILSGCYYEMGEMEKAIETVKEAVEHAEKIQERLMCFQYEGYLYLKSEQYERCVDVCDQIIEEEPQYFPAYLQRQEAYFELRNGQKVVDDYHNAVNVYAGYYKPYLLAAQVFFYHEQYEDGKGVLERARENQVEFSSQMKLFEVKILRNLAETSEDRKRPLEICEELLNEEDHGDIEDPSEIPFEKGLLLWDDGDYAQALKYLDQAISQNEDRMQYRMVKGNLLREMERYQEALACYRQAEDHYEQTPGLYYNMGLCYEFQKLPGQARENYERVLELREDYADTLERLADLYWDDYKEQGRPADRDKAIRYMSRQLEQEETCYDLVHRGLMFMGAMELDRAIADYEKALEYRPDDWAAYNNLGYCYKMLGQYEKSLEMYERSLECCQEKPSILIYSNMADVYEILQDYEQAIACYRKDLEWYPKETIFWEEIGDLYSYLGQYDQAREAYEKASERKGYTGMIGGLLLRQGKRRQGLLWYLRNLKKKDQDSWSELGDQLADIFASYRLAAYCYRRAIAIETDPYELFLLELEAAWAYYRAGDWAKAQKHALESVEHFKKANKGTLEEYAGYASYGPARKAAIGRLMLCIGGKEEGLSALEQIDQIPRCKNCRYQSCYEAYQHLGDYYRAHGQLEKARECYEEALRRNSHSTEVRERLRRLKKRLKNQR